ncbi:hypothetical protein ACFLZW_02035 [Chloroflexota bacterium]
MKLNFWVGMAFGIAVFLWPCFYTLKLKQYTEPELINISPKYQGINKTYLKYGIWGTFIFIPILLGLIFPIINFETEQRTNLLSAYIVVVFSATSLFYGLFAVKQGVYPASKYFGSKTKYIYDEKGGLEKLGRLQSFISVAVGIIGVTGVVVLLLNS